MVTDCIRILDKGHHHQARRGLLLTVIQQLPIALGFYATGTFQRTTGEIFGVSVFAACTVIHKISRAIAKQKGQSLSFPENLSHTKRKFSDTAHFPGVIEAINCTHIRILCPNKENAMAFGDRKQLSSIKLSKQFVRKMPLAVLLQPGELDQLMIHPVLRTAGLLTN